MIYLVLKMIKEKLRTRNKEIFNKKKEEIKKFKMLKALQITKKIRNLICH